ncbi:DNA-binding transcriptional regulator Fis [Halomonas sp. TRM85114]|uniref:DNA-binding transcriptional regulator Fis n=1 Tax=Halomonas jincaotanensis TaxID=2810616 RepID=UPI001BD3210B|nr:DNA-binding transcriptional regulator Fis [Halomonas jincaotanensis]MBS9403979.1 DNA-binding transcriptional regulator Fis [Halomonas jincaotanensis]
MTSQAFPNNPTLPGQNAQASHNLDGTANPGQDKLSLDEPSLDEPAAQQPLREVVDSAMRRYFAHLDGGDVTGLYAMVMAEVEAPLFATVLDYAQGNQTRAAEILGLNRGTLRKKLKQYDLI